MVLGVVWLCGRGGCGGSCGGCGLWLVVVLVVV